MKVAFLESRGFAIRDVSCLPTPPPHAVLIFEGYEWLVIHERTTCRVKVYDTNRKVGYKTLAEFRQGEPIKLQRRGNDFTPLRYGEVIKSYVHKGSWKEWPDELNV